MDKYEQKKHMLCINDFGVVGKEVFMSNGNFNALIIYDLENKKISHIEKFVGIDYSTFSPHRICKVYKNKVFFFPQNGNTVNVFDVDSKQQKFLELNKVAEMHGVQFVFQSKGEFYLLPYYGKEGMIYFNVDSPEKYKKVEWWVSDELKNANSLRSGKYDEKKIWTQCVGSNTLLITDIFDRTIEKYNIELGKNNIHMIEFDGNNFWITIENGAEIYKWNVNDGVQDVFDIPMEVFDICPCKVHICTKDRIFLFFKGRKELFMLDANKREIVLLSSLPDWVIYPYADWTVYYKPYGDSIFLFCNFTSLIIEVDMKSLKVNYYSTVIEKNQIYEEHCLKDYAIEENKCYDWKRDVKSYLNMVIEYM